MNWWQAAILGIIQGLTEFIPVSSSGHLILMREFFGITYGGFLFFDLLLHVATLLAIVLVFYKDIINIFRAPFKVLGFLVLASIPAVIVGLFLSDLIERLLWDNASLLWIFFLITAMLLLASEMYEKRQTPKAFILDNINGVKRRMRLMRNKANEANKCLEQVDQVSEQVVAVGAGDETAASSTVGAVTDRPPCNSYANENPNETPVGAGAHGRPPCQTHTNDNSNKNTDKTPNTPTEYMPDLKFKHVAAMGLMQAVALIPGISRSGSTIFGGVMTRGRRTTIAKFSFLMSIPIILGALLRDLFSMVFGGGAAYVAPTTAVIPWYAFTLGILLSFVVGFFAIKFMVKLISKADFKWFSLYLFILSIVTFVMFFI